MGSCGGHADVGSDGWSSGIQKAASKTVTDSQPASGGNGRDKKTVVDDFWFRHGRKKPQDALTG